MRDLFRSTLTRLCVIMLAVGLVAPAIADETPSSSVDINQNGAELVEVITPFVFNGDLRDLPSAVVWKPGDPIKEIPRRFIERPGMNSSGDPGSGSSAPGWIRSRR